MSEQQSQTATATGEQSCAPDDSEPRPERQAQLQAAYEANLARGRAPYQDVRIQTRGELQWVMSERRWAGELFPDRWPDGTMHTGYSHANLSGVYLGEAILKDIHLRAANLSHADLANCDLRGALFDHANLSGAQLYGSKLAGANFLLANLAGANLIAADLSDGGVLSSADLTGADLTIADLRGAFLSGARMDARTNLKDVHLDSKTYLSDVVWNGVPLTRVNWQEVDGPGEEHAARQSVDRKGKPKDAEARLREYGEAVVANRQVATVLRSQGLNEHADRFAYRAQLCQRAVLRRQAFTRVKGQPHGSGWRVRKLTAYLGSWFLWLIAGYGYRPLWSFATYLLVVTVFGLAYWALGIQTGHTLTWNEAVVVSVTAFHGRGFFATAFQPGDPQAAAAAVEAVIGLLIEITLIATFTQRFFAR